MHSGECEAPSWLDSTLGDTEIVEWLELTDLGQEALKAAKDTHSSSYNQKLNQVELT